MIKKVDILKFLGSKFKDNKKFIVFVLFVFIPIRSAIADWNYVPTGSMNPTIMEGDWIFINKAAYDLRIPLTLTRVTKWADPEEGDIVVLFSPEDNVRVVKRVIAEPGDRLAMYNNILFKNGHPLTYEKIPVEAFPGLSHELIHHGKFYREKLGNTDHSVTFIPTITSNKSFQEITVPEGQYFVMGDNRDNSKDSRSYGFINRELIIGKAVSVICSVNKTDSYQPRLSRFFKWLR